ncbi:SHOCT domain-containing protein [Kitasatospora aureofaciens]|uniref:SHOCT domain-containing protein n=1 Tax=Kitasatospora aureofaciens TaxID=1894 RepID=UPI0033ECB552
MNHDVHATGRLARAGRLDPAGAPVLDRRGGSGDHAAAPVGVAAVRRLRVRRRGPARGGAPLAVLGRRFAEGDIDAEEYRAKRAVLTEPTKDVPGGGGAR